MIQRPSLSFTPICSVHDTLLQHSNSISSSMGYHPLIPFPLVTAKTFGCLWLDRVEALIQVKTFLSFRMEGRKSKWVGADGILWEEHDDAQCVLLIFWNFFTIKMTVCQTVTMQNLSSIKRIIVLKHNFLCPKNKVSYFQPYFTLIDKHTQ